MRVHLNHLRWNTSTGDPKVFADIKLYITSTSKLFVLKISRTETWEKCTFWHVRPTKILITLRMRTVWSVSACAQSESSLSAWRNFASLTIPNAPSEDSDQTARLRSLIRIFAGRTLPMGGFLTLRLILLLWYYGEPSLQRQHLFPKTLPLKWICYCTEYKMSRLICKKGLVLFLFPHRTYILDIC